MAAKDNDCDQLEAAKQLLDVTRKYSSLLEQNNNLMRTQNELSRQIMSHTKCVEESSTTTTESLADALESLEKINDTSLDDISDKLDDVAKKGEKSRGILSSLGSVLGSLLAGAASIASWAVGKLWDTLKLAGGIVSTAIGAVFDIIGAVWDLGKAILSIPFAAYSWLIGKANDLMSGGGSAYAEAIRALKTEYGALDQVAPSTIMKISRETQSISKHGLSAFRIWGSLGERMKALTELAQKMGPTFENFAQEFDETGLQIPALLKGLGLADEQVKILGDRAKTMGTRFQDELVDMHKQSWALGGAFGHSTKLLNRDMAKAMGDVKRFGGATTAQLGQSALHARSLGLELEKVAGILDAFETFESAADVASKFAQSFGVQIEAFDMLNAQDTATIIDHMRQKFAEAGQDASTFNRAQLDVLTQGSKLAPEVAKQVFSLKNQGRSLEEIQKESEKAQNTFGNLDTALHDLRKSIEYLVMSGSMPKGGFLDMFLAGIERGINLNPHTRGLFRDIAKSLRLTYYDARSVFDGFVEYFPGVKDAINGLREVFNPVKLGTLIRGINDDIVSFFRLFSKGQMTFGQLIDNLSQRFKDYLGSATEGGSKFLDGLGAFGRAVAELAGQIIEWLGKALADGIRGIADFIRNPDDLINTGKSIASGAAEVGESLWEPMWRGIKGAIAEIKPALGELFTALLDEIPMLKEFMKLFDKVIYKSKEVKGYAESTNADGTKTYTQNIQESAGEETYQIFASIREFWDEIRLQFDDFINNPNGFFEKFLNVLKSLEPVINALIYAVAGLALVGLGRAAVGSLGAIARFTGMAGAAAITAAGAATPAVSLFNVISSNAREDFNKATAEAMPGGSVAVKVGADVNVASEGTIDPSTAHKVQGLLSSFDEKVNAAKSINFIDNKQISSASKELETAMEQIQKELADNQTSIDATRRQKLKEALDSQESKLIAMGQKAAQEDRGQLKVIDAALQRVDRMRSTAGLDPSTNSGRALISAETKKKEEKPKILPAVAVDTLKTLTFSQTSEALQMLTKELEGKSSFKGLVMALSAADKDIKAHDAVKSSQNVALFMQHVEQIAASLSGMQRLVDVTDAEGKGNFKVIEDNVSGVADLFESLVNEGSIKKLTGSIGSLNTQLPSTDITQKVRDFFEHLGDISNRLKVISGTDIKDIDSEKIKTAIGAMTTALGAIIEKIDPLKEKITTLGQKLGAVIGEATKENPNTVSSNITGIAKTINQFSNDFQSIGAALKKIAAVEKEFSGDGGDVPTIDPVKIQEVIGKMSSSVSALSTALVPPAKAPGDTSAPAGGAQGLSKALETFVDKGKLKKEFSALSSKDGPLGVFRGFIGGVAEHIGDADNANTILGSMSVFEKFSAGLTTLKPLLDGLDLGVLTTWLDKFKDKIPEATVYEPHLEKFKHIVEAFKDTDFSEGLGIVSDSLTKANEIGSLIKGAAGSTEDLKTSVADVSKQIGSSHLSFAEVKCNWEINLDVKLSAGAIEAVLLNGTTVRGDLQKALSGGGASAPGAPAAAPK